MNHTTKITDQFHLDVYNRFPVTLTKGKGATVWTDDGRELIDALAGIAVNSLGHCHPKVVEAIKGQAEKLMHISNFYYNEPQARLVQMLAECSGLDRIFLCNSGAEAIEAAVKLARKYGHAHDRSGPILTMSNAFHGRTITTISMGMEKYAKGYAPLAKGFQKVIYNDVESLRQAFKENPIAIILETIQGSGGLDVASTSFMETVQELCNKHDTLLIIDEIQTGIARTGKMWSFQHYNIKPDIIASAKALGGGFPTGAMMAKESVASVMKYGSHGSTFGGNPLACTAAVASLTAVIDEDLIQQAAEKGTWLKQYLKKEAPSNRAIKDIRGKGLMMGVELTFEGRPVVEEMLKRGVLSNCTQGNVIRLVPPLVITRTELQKVADVLIASINQVHQINVHTK